MKENTRLSKGIFLQEGFPVILFVDSIVPVEAFPVDCSTSFLPLFIQDEPLLCPCYCMILSAASLAMITPINDLIVS